IAADGDVNDEDLIAREDVVVTITETGYAKRTKTDLYRSQKRGGKGVQGAGLKQDDIVRHFFVCSTHDWILFFTTQGRVYRAKAYDLPEASRTARGQHVANLLVGAVLCSAEDDLLLVSANGQSIRFSATDEALRPMGRATSGVQGMR